MFTARISHLTTATKVRLCLVLTTLVMVSSAADVPGAPASVACAATSDQAGCYCMWNNDRWCYSSTYDYWYLSGKCGY